MLIVLEGAEGVGKTTQLGLLAERVRALGIEVMTLREPGGTALGDAIRQILLDPSQHIVPEAEVLLFLASRAQLVRTQIDPALSRGVVVLMDRFFLSTYAYQIVGRGLDEERVRAATMLATAGRTPDLTIVLKLPAGVGLARASERSGYDRIESSGREFHERVGAAFSLFADPGWQRRHPECGPVVVVDAQGSAGDVHARIVDTLARNLPSRFGHISGENAG